MRTRNIAPLVLILVFTWSVSVRAEIIAKVGDYEFAQNSGVQTLDVLVSSTSPEQDALWAFSLLFELRPGDSFTNPPGFFNPPGEFGRSDMVGFGQLANSSFLTKDNASRATLSLDFVPDTGMQFPADDGGSLIATLWVDVNGLDPGVYDVILIEPDPSGAIGPSGIVDMTTSNGTFTIVPEPSSAFLFAAVLGGMGLVVWRRRRRS